MLVDDRRHRRERSPSVIVLGVILLVVGFLTGISILWSIGIALVVIGAILALVGGTGRKIGGRAHWY
jgi:hypothetical protein